MLTNPAAKEQVKVLKWLLVHDQTVRPFAEQLLSSDLLPPAQLEASELQEMLRHALANPQSKAYKHLVSRCLAQKSDTVLELTYHLGLVTSSALLKMIKVIYFILLLIKCKHIHSIIMCSVFCWNPEQDHCAFPQTWRRRVHHSTPLAGPAPGRLPNRRPSDDPFGQRRRTSTRSANTLHQDHGT